MPWLQTSGHPVSTGGETEKKASVSAALGREGLKVSQRIRTQPILRWNACVQLSGKQGPAEDQTLPLRSLQNPSWESSGLLGAMMNKVDRRASGGVHRNQGWPLDLRAAKKEAGSMAVAPKDAPDVLRLP